MLLNNCLCYYLGMTKSMNYRCCKWLVFIGILFCWSTNATDQKKSIESQIEWTVDHLKDGKTRFEYVHDNKTHFYEVKLTGIEIDGESIILSKPAISVQKNQVTKQWLPYLKETWFNTEGYIKWSFEIKRPDFLSDSAKQITLKYDVETDGEGGLTVGDQTSINYDIDFDGKTIHEYNNQDMRDVNMTVFGSRCHNAVSIAGYPSKNKSVVFELNDKSFPLYTQGHISRWIKRISHNNFHDSLWDLAKLSEQNNMIQMVVPIKEVINDQLVHSINVFQHKKPNVGSNQGIKHNVDFVKINKQDIYGFIKTAGNWHQLMMDRVNLNKWEFDKGPGISHLEKIKQALSSFGNLDVDYFFGKSIVIHGKYLYAISNESETNKILILKNKGNQWIKQDPIVIQKQVIKLNPRKVSREIEEVIVKNDLMVVAMQVTSFRTPLKSEDNQSLGEVRVYRKVNNQWLLEKILVPELGNSEDSFGKVIVLADNTVLVSANRFTEGYQGSLNGLVHVFKYKSGQWQKPDVIKPPNHAKERGYYNEAGFGSELQLIGDDLYIKAGSLGYSSTNINQPNISGDCPYFDSLGVIYHYRKVGNKWKLLHEIKSKGDSNSLVGPMLANSTGLYFLSSSYVNSLPVIHMKHYRDGKIKWQKKLSY
jgi:hypothetical protein